MVKTQKFMIYRKKPGEDKPRYDKFEIPVKEGMSVLEALFYIQDFHDPTLAFRYACRGAICGSCGMTIDKYPRLACRTQVAVVKTQNKPPKLPQLDFGDDSTWDQEKEILIEPLPNMKVIKDLVVDIDPFFKFYRQVHPYFEREWNDSAPESLQDPKDAKSIESLVYCILCGICWTCPVNSTNKNYIGPAALAKAYRFISDTRISDSTQKVIVDEVMKKDGVPSCEQHFVCNRVCPKNVQPGTAIKHIRDAWSSDK